MSSDELKISVIERHYRACWNCIQVGVHHKCAHYKERVDDERLEHSKINPTAVMLNLVESKMAHGGDPSPIETMLLAAFWRAGLEPEQQHRIAGFIVDFAFPKARLVVEADGAAYHQDEEREQRRDAAIRKSGWHVVHFTGSEVNQDADGCVASVYQLARAAG